MSSSSPKNTLKNFFALSAVAVMVISLLAGSLPTLAIGQSQLYQDLKAQLQKNGTVEIMSQFGADDSQADLKQNPTKPFGDQESQIKSRLEKSQKSIAKSTKFNTYSPYSSTTVTSLSELNELFEDSDLVPISENQLSQPDLINSNTAMSTASLWNSTSPKGNTGQNKIIAILDTGVNYNHEFLVGKKAYEACFSFVAVSATQSSLCSAYPYASTASGSGLDCLGASGCSHGTHVAGIAAGKDPISTTSLMNGVAKDAKIMAIQVFTQFNSQTDCGTRPAPCILSYNTAQIDALSYVNTVASNLITTGSLERVASSNLSLGGGNNTSTCDTNPLKTRIDNLLTNNVATTISAGNSGQFGVASPACISSAITVGATDNSTVPVIASFSQAHPSLVDIFAPGVSINSSINSLTNNEYQNYSGTSMSAPQVAGAFALMQNAFPLHTVNQNLQVLKDTGTSFVYNRNGVNYTGKRLKFCPDYIRSKTGTKPWVCVTPV
ncbi:MAG: S8 family serine peptidase [Candidatus Parcubacteria bacterium]|nr:S8 family serine peptidase [Candidatus Paceibacterota bacterium]